jgi:hypothetical protein
MSGCAASKLRTTHNSGEFEAAPATPVASFRLWAGFFYAWFRVRGAGSAPMRGLELPLVSSTPVPSGLGGMGAVQYNRTFREGRTRFFRVMRVCIFFP